MQSLRFQNLLTPSGFRPAEIHIDDDGRIVSVDDAAGADDWDGWIALPGMVNAHSHSFQRAMTGLAEAGAGPRSFWGWRDVMYRVAQSVSPDGQYAIAEQAFREMLAAGYTSVGEFHYLHHEPDGAASTQMADAVAAAAASSGIRLALLPVYYARGGFDTPAAPAQKRFVHPTPQAFIDYVARLGPAVCGIAPHSLRAVAVEDLAWLVAAARDQVGSEARIHIHIAEQRREVSECLDATGYRPVTLLREHVVPDRRWSLVHATHVSDHELDAIVSDAATVVLCPLTEAHLGDGIFPATRYADNGGIFAIGSDCNARIDAIEELRLLEYGQRLVNESRPCLHSDAGLGAGLWAAAARGGARSLGIDAGAIARGLYADLVVLAQSAPLTGLAPRQALDAWLVGGSREQIDRVYLGGRRIETNRATSPEFAGLVRRLGQVA